MRELPRRVPTEAETVSASKSLGVARKSFQFKEFEVPNELALLLSTYFSEIIRVAPPGVTNPTGTTCCRATTQSVASTSATAV